MSSFEAVAADPAAGFDHYPSGPVGSEIASGPYLYSQAAARLQEHHTGGPNQRLTVEEEQKLATVIQASNNAQTGLDSLLDTDPAKYLVEKQRYSKLLASGETAVLKLVESHLRVPAYLARASMGQVTLRPGERVGAFADIRLLRSRYADPEERAQVANLGLIRAARTFKPIIGEGGEPVRFYTHALWQIQSDLTQHVKVHETPGWYVGHNFTDEIHEARNYPESLNAEVLATLVQADEGRDTVSLDDLSFVDTYIEDEEEPPEILTVADVLQDDTEAVEYDALTNTVASLVDKALEEMTVVKDLKKDEPADKRAQREEYARRNVEILRLRLGISELPEHYGKLHTYKQIGEIVGLTDERVHQVVGREMFKLRIRLKPLADGSHTDDRIDLGSYYTPQTAKYFSQLRTHRVIAHEALESTVMSSLDRPAFPYAQGSTPEESWQAYPGEPFDMQAITAESEQAYEEVSEQFTQMLLHINPYSFQDSFTKAVNTEYPVTAVDNINRQFGNSLRASHIERFWNEHLEQFVSSLLGTTEDITLDRVTTLFAQLLAERMDDESSVTLRIPENLAGSLNFLGAWLEHGQMHIEGEAGDFVGYRMRGLAGIHVEGSVRDYAGVAASGYSSLEVTGDAGHYCGSEIRQAQITVHGSVGDYCGTGINGDHAAIEVDGNAGEEVGADGRKGTILIGGSTGSISKNHGNVIINTRAQESGAN